MKGISNIEHRMSNVEMRKLLCSVFPVGTTNGNIQCILFFLLFLSLSVFSQNKKIDSLLTLLKTDKEDTNKANHLNKLSNIYLNIGSYDCAMLHANSGLHLSNVILKQTTNPIIKQTAQKGEAKAYNIIGNVYYAQGNYPEALKNHFTSLKIREALGDKKGVSDSYNNIGNVYMSQGNYPEALNNHFASLKIRKAIGDKQGIASSYNNIGTVYYNQGNYPDALKNYFACLKIMEVLGDKQSVAISYNNIGNVYEAQGNYPEASPTERNLSFGRALKNQFASLKIYESIGAKKGIAASYINIGSIYTKQKKYRKAEDYLIKGKDLSKEIEDKEYLRGAYSGLTELDSTKGDFKSAYENHKLYILYSDSLDNEQTRKKTIQTQMTYDFEKKEAVANAEHKKELENQKALADEKSRKQKIVLLFVVGGLLLVVVFAGFIFRSLRLTRKQKELIELQKKVVEEHQKEILDSIHYAKRIQQSLLPTEKHIMKNLNRLAMRNPNGESGNMNNQIIK